MGETGRGMEIDRKATARRIEEQLSTLAAPPFSATTNGVSRYAYTAAYRRTLDYLVERCEEVGLSVSWDPIGTLIARNVPPGEPVVALGSHCDSVRGGGPWDGTLGVLAALEVCRLARELQLGIGLQVMSFLEEEGAGFGRSLLGSSLMAGEIAEEDLREGIRFLDDGRSLWVHAVEAGFDPARWRDSVRALENVSAWIELHIEQGRVLQDTGRKLGVVSAIAGYIHADLKVLGQADHAGATPMDFRLDAALPAAETVVELERLALAAGDGTVATVGDAELVPGQINVVAGEASLTLDIRGTRDEAVTAVAEEIRRFAVAAARRRKMRAIFTDRASLPATALDDRVRAALTAAAKASRVPHSSMPSGAVHDTMCLARRVPSGMLFIPCRDGISHSPAESASPADAAGAIEVMLGAVAELGGDRTAA